MGTVSKLSRTGDDDALRKQYQAALDEGLSQTEFARLAGTSTTTLSRWMGGKYPGDNEKVARKIAQALDALADRRAAAQALPNAPGFVATPTAEKILATLRYAQIASDLVVIYGGAGMSKTASILRYATTAPNVWHATMHPASSGVVQALEEVARALGIALNTGNWTARAHHHVVDKMAGTHGLLVIDEAQHLNVAALDQMRSIHDATGCGMALVGNEQVYTNMAGKRAAYLDRLYSRVGKRLRLNKPLVSDVTAILDAWDINAADCTKLLREIANKPGGLRILTKTLRLASMYAAGDERTIECTDIKAAWRELGGAE